MTKEQKVIIALIKKSLNKDCVIDDAIFEGVNWARVIDEATEQGVLGVCFDAIGLLPEEYRPDIDNLMEWVGQVEYQVTQYDEHKTAIAKLADFYHKHYIKMLLMKGYGLSLNYPVPQHRPTGDIDIYLFGDKEKADNLVSKEMRIDVDEEYHKHSHFVYNGITIENHGKFIDDVTHKSNVRFEEILENQLKVDSLKFNESPIGNCYLPSATWNALFLLRHAGEHFASEEIKLRHLLDLAFFFNHESIESNESIDWDKVLKVYCDENMISFYNAISTICVRDLGFDPCIFHGYVSNDKLADRVLEDIFAEKQELPKSMVGINTPMKKLKYGIQKSIRWHHNRWKYRMVYKESMWESFCGLALNRLKS